MNFPINHCIQTKHLTKESYSWLITKLVTEGYSYDSKLEMHNLFDMWKFIGTNGNKDILTYDNNLHYIDIDEEPFFNILSEEFVKEYLSEDNLA